MEIKKQSGEGDPLGEIAEAIYRLRITFQKHGLNPPASIELYGYEDFMKLRAMKDAKSRFFVEHGLMNPETWEPVNQAELAGIKLRVVGTQAG